MNMQEPSVIILVFITIGISLLAFFNRSILSRLILSPYLVVHKKQWYRVITHAFIHADWMHLLFNMLALWSFGIYVMGVFRYITDSPEKHFYIMYFVAIILSTIPDLLKHKNDMNYLSLGASGAVSAVVFCAIFFDPWNLVYVFFLPCPGIVFGVLYLIYSSYMGKKGGDRINHDAHFYGALLGFVYPILINPSSYQIFFEKLMHPSFL